ncbi:hypothetical protein ACFXAZ_23190, partial [Streptomyces sp. NPDC059477]|uniref:pPIWI_RE_Z domain-containing protein n=1 Tax=Streptomyces sp. NPDC059477 TaxID=3346847 RepID=UPI003680F279
MRSTDLSLAEVTCELSRSAPDLKNPRLVSLCEIEIGLLLQERFAADAPAEDAWVLFSGYPFARAWGAVDETGEQTLRTARYTLWTWSRRRAWADALKEYQRLDRQLRAYDVADLERPAVRRPPRWGAARRGRAVAHQGGGGPGRGGGSAGLAH